VQRRGNEILIEGKREDLLARVGLAKPQVDADATIQANLRDYHETIARLKAEHAKALEAKNVEIASLRKDKTPVLVKEPLEAILVKAASVVGCLDGLSQTINQETVHKARDNAKDVLAFLNKVVETTWPEDGKPPEPPAPRGGRRRRFTAGEVEAISNPSLSPSLGSTPAIRKRWRNGAPSWTRSRKPRPRLRRRQIPWMRARPAA
jgi:hypothetical protein